MWIPFYMMIQCTWGLLQTVAGLILFLRHFPKPHKLYHGAIHTEWADCRGVSLGLFIFTPCEAAGGCEELTRHEYGHTYQSLLLGPLYLVVIGIPSFVWLNGARYQRLRAEKGIPYSFFFTERWADGLGGLAAQKWTNDVK